MLPSLQVFGWPKTEVEGKNVSVLMPAPHSQQHTGFIRNYLDSGKAKVLNTTRELQALHRDRFVFPVKLALTKIAQGGEAAALSPLWFPANAPAVWFCCCFWLALPQSQLLPSVPGFLQKNVACQPQTGRQQSCFLQAACFCDVSSCSITLKSSCYRL